MKTNQIAGKNIPEPYPKMYLYRRIVLAKRFIDNRYAEHIDLDNIAEEAYFSKFHFIRLFKNSYGKTPHQYLISVRIEKAMQLLRRNESVLEVCHAVGFESLPSFSGLFKRMTGMTPSAFSEQQQLLNAHMRQAPLTYIPGCFARQHGWTKNSNFEETGL